MVLCRLYLLQILPRREGSPRYEGILSVLIHAKALPVGNISQAVMVRSP